MAFISWRSDYVLGVHQIDAEHLRLFNLINAYHDAQAGGGGNADVAQVLNRLIAYAEEHFQHEEQLMREVEFPRLAQHQALHEDLVKAIFEVNAQRALNPERARREVLVLVKDWLIEHILKEDMDLADFIKRKRAREAKKMEAEATGTREDAPAAMVLGSP